MRIRDKVGLKKSDALLAYLSSACGIFWGLIGFWLARDTGLRPEAWVGLAMSPLIGLCVGLVADRVRPKGWPRQLLFSFLTFYGSVTAFLVVLYTARAVSELDLSPLFRGISTVHVVLYWFTVFGYGVILCPLAVFNHRWLWRVTDTEG
jgi:hypothetical protein